MKNDDNYFNKNAPKDDKITSLKIKNMFDIIREGLDIIKESVKESINENKNEIL